jgi:hypothetical protein
MTDLVQMSEDWSSWLPALDVVQMNGPHTPSLREQHKEQLLFQECN